MNICPSVNILFYYSYRVPGSFLCSPEVPSSAYSSASEADTIKILKELEKSCNGTEDSEVPAPMIYTKNRD